MDEGRKRVIGIMAAILTAMHMRTADDLFGTPQGSPRTDRLIAASIQWAKRIMQKIDDRFGKWVMFPHHDPKPSKSGSKAAMEPAVWHDTRENDTPSLVNAEYNHAESVNPDCKLRKNFPTRMGSSAKERNRLGAAFMSEHRRERGVTILIVAIAMISML